MADQAAPIQNVRTPAIDSSKGQVINAKFFTTRNLSVIVTGAVLITAMVRADPKDIPKIVETIAGSHDVAIIGWAVALVVLAGSIVFIRMSSKIHDREIERLVSERDLLQKRLLTGGQ